MDIVTKVLGGLREVAVVLDSACAPLAKTFLEEVSQRKEKIAREKDPSFFDEVENENLNERIDREEEFMNSLFGDLWWEEIIESLSSGFFEKQVSLMLEYHQRAIRGWADNDVWGLDFSFTRVLGEQLIFLSQKGTGWPNNDKYETYTSWTEDLRKHGEILLAYSSKNNWFKDNGEILEYKDIVAENNKREKEAKQSLRWVAANLTYLWD